MAKTTRPAESSKKQPRGKPFQPGQSGNPGGRKPKTPEERTLEAMCRDRTQDALAVLLEIMTNGEQERNRITAAMAVIERGHGKAVQPTTLSGPEGGPVDMNWTVEFVKPRNEA
jgi:hypothetical protein